MDYQPLLEAIRADPGDELARRAYADWLEETGEPERAEFIRLQLHLRTRPRDRGEELEHLRRLRALIVANRGRWLGPLARVAPETLFENGFVHQVRLRASDFLTCGEEVLTSHPITRLQIVGAENELFRLAACVALTRVPHVELQVVRLTPILARVIANSTHLTTLTVLDAQRAEAGGEALAAIAASETLPGLTTLLLAGNNLGLGGLELFLPILALPALTRLDLSANNLRSYGAARLAQSTRLGKLHTLLLRSNGFDRQDVLRLAESPALAGLRLLDLTGNLPWNQTGALNNRFRPRVLL